MMNHQCALNIKRSLFIILSLSGCCTHQSPQPNNGVCDIDSSTEFGNTLLTDARRISRNQNIRVFTDCKELQELKSGKRNKLTSWGYNMSLEEAQRVSLENVQLNAHH
jgi:hypothetical protein